MDFTFLDGKPNKEIKKCINDVDEKDENIKKINEQLKYYCDEYYSNMRLSDKNEIKNLLNKGAIKEIIYDYSKFEKFKFFVEEFGFPVEKIIQKDKYKKRILEWFKYYCSEYFRSDVNRYLTYIHFLLNLSKKFSFEFELIYEQMRCYTIEQFMFLIKRSIIYEQILKDMKNCNDWGKKLIGQLNVYLENVANYNSFKRLVKEDTFLLVKLRKIEEWNKDLQYRLDRWLEEEFVNYNRENINFLINKCGASKESALKISIENSHFKAFKNLVEEDKKLLEDLRKEKDWNDRIKKQLYGWLEKELEYKYVIKGNINFLIQSGASEEEVLNNSIKQFNREIFRNIIRRKILSREDIKGLKINNETLIKELIEYIYEENGLESRTLENKIMRPEKFDEETKKLIIEIVSRTHPERANILKIRLNLK